MHITRQEAEALGIVIPDDEEAVEVDIPPRPQKSIRSIIAPYKSKTEREYAGTLEARKLAGEIRLWRYEPFSMELAEGVRFRPDFEVVHNDGHIELVEVKGPYVREDARIKFRVAVDKYVEYSWLWAQRQKGGVWDIKSGR
jgi:hypothetical protein